VTTRPNLDSEAPTTVAFVHGGILRVGSPAWARMRRLLGSKLLPSTASSISRQPAPSKGISRNFIGEVEVQFVECGAETIRRRFHASMSRETQRGRVTVKCVGSERSLQVFGSEARATTSDLRVVRFWCRMHAHACTHASSRFRDGRLTHSSPAGQRSRAVPSKPCVSCHAPRHPSPFHLRPNIFCCNSGSEHGRLLYSLVLLSSNAFMSVGQWNLPLHGLLLG